MNTPPERVGEKIATIEIEIGPRGGGDAELIRFPDGEHAIVLRRRRRDGSSGYLTLPGGAARRWARAIEMLCDRHNVERGREATGMQRARVIEMEITAKKTENDK